MLRKLVLEFPEELSDEDLHDKEVVTKGKEGVIMALLRKGKISQGKAAELLDISRHELFDLMARYDVPGVEMTDEELTKELSKEVFKK
ncbi:MAG: UPF0175 family protein [bacterium]